MLEKIHQYYPEAKKDFLLRKGNENLLMEHPYLNKIHLWNKKKNKYKNLIGVLFNIRKEEYDVVINLQRFISTGLLTIFSNASYKIGFEKNPVSFLFNKAVSHEITAKSSIHEIERNHRLIEEITDKRVAKPRLYPTEKDFNIHIGTTQYYCIAPTSVWFTKQFPLNKWVELIHQLPSDTIIYILGGPDDERMCSKLKNRTGNPNVVNKAGKLSLLQSAALMKGAKMNFVNDSGPMHLCSAVNAPVRAVFCSTVPAFGFGPLSDDSRVIETDESLDCRPCNLHGYTSCPKGHFKCSNIQIQSILNTIKLN